MLFKHTTTAIITTSSIEVMKRIPTHGQMPCLRDDYPNGLAAKKRVDFLYEIGHIGCKRTA